MGLKKPTMPWGSESVSKCRTDAEHSEPPPSGSGDKCGVINITCWIIESLCFPPLPHSRGSVLQHSCPAALMLGSGNPNSGQAKTNHALSTCSAGRQFLRNHRSDSTLLSRLVAKGCQRQTAEQPRPNPTRCFDLEPNKAINGPPLLQKVSTFSDFNCRRIVSILSISFCLNDIARKERFHRPVPGTRVFWLVDQVQTSLEWQS